MAGWLLLQALRISGCQIQGLPNTLLLLSGHGSWGGGLRVTIM